MLLLFVVGIVFGLVGGDGVVVLVVLVGYLIMNVIMGKVLYIIIDDIFLYVKGVKELS